MTYTNQERFWLSVIAVVGIAGLNGLFLWAFVTQPGSIAAAMQNPVSAAFIIEAFVLVGLLAYLLARWQVSRIHWAWFVVLSLVGGLAFALPVAVLWRRRA